MNLIYVLLLVFLSFAMLNFVVNDIWGKRVKWKENKQKLKNKKKEKKKNRSIKSYDLTRMDHYIILAS